jgi:hypothetical protein
MRTKLQLPVLKNNKNLIDLIPRYRYFRVIINLEAARLKVPRQSSVLY